MARRSPLLPTWLYGKRLRWRGRDEWGTLEVVDGVLGLELHFGSKALQGRINLDQPWRPLAEYTVSMAALAALPEPQRRQRDETLPDQPTICLLGLGTGSLAWTYHRLIPHAHLTAIELRPAVIEVGVELFGLSKLEALKMIRGDALDEVTRLAERSQTLISIDLFTDEGMAPCLKSSVFWQQVARILHPCGSIAVNVWSGDQEAFKEILTLIKTYICPEGDILMIDHELFGNYIILASPRSLKQESSLARARKIDDRLNSSPPPLASRLCWRVNSTQKWARASYEAGLSGESIQSRLKRAWMSKHEDLL